MSSSGSWLNNLFSGQAPPNVSGYSQNLTQMPSWLLNSTNAAVSQANSVAGQPYQAYQGPQVAPWTQDQNQAQQQVEQMQGKYQPTLQSGINMAQGATQPGQFQAAQGLIPQASSAIQGGMAPTMAQMNPYINNVIGNAQTQTEQFWKNKLQPSINAQFTAGGNYGSAANQNAQNLASNDLTTALNQQSLGALSGAYSNAQQAGLAGGQALGTLAQTQGGLGYEQGMLGLQGAGTLGNLATTGQSLGMQGAGTLFNMGQAQQQQGQQNLNTAYQNFQNQTYYPQNQLSWLSGILSGAPASSGSLQSGNKQQPLPGASYGASPFNTALGVYNGLNSLGGSQQ